MKQTKTIPIVITLNDGSTRIMLYVVEGNFSSGGVIDKLVSEGRAKKNEDGSIRLLSTNAAIQSEINKQRYKDQVVSWRKLKNEELPNDRRYRNTWKDYGNKIDLDLDKARAERLNELRKERNQKLDQLDKEINTIEDNGGDARALRAKRPALRDMPVLIKETLDNASTADELDAITLDMVEELS